MKASLRAIWAVWQRYFAIFRKNFWFGVVTTFVEPFLYLASFGFGVGGLVGSIECSGVTLSYRQFVFAGIAGQTVLFQSFFEAAYGGFVRMYYQKIFKAIAMTPITLSEVLWGELIWDATRATVSVFAVLMMGVAVGDFHLWGSLLAVPISFLCALTFAGIGLLSAAWAPSIDAISYPQFLFIFPMFLFCGVFFPLERLPEVLQWIAWGLPLTATVSVLRSLTLGFPLEPRAVVVALFWLVIAVSLARRRMLNRLVK